MIEVNIPQIEVPQKNGSSWHKEFMYLLPMSGLYGRLNLRYTEYAARHNFINKLLRDVYYEHSLGEKIRKNDEYYSFDVQHYTYKCNIETVIYWLRKTADEVISLLYYLHYVKLNKTEPTRIVVDCIGRLLNEKGEVQEMLQNHLSFLGNLNDVSNCYKHSFANNETNDLIGVDEPTVVGLHIKGNDANKGYVYHNYFLRDIVISYNTFFKFITEKMREMHPYW